MKDYLVDIAAVLFICLSILITARKGFIKSIISSIWLIIAVVGGTILKPVFFAVYKTAGLLEKVTESITENAKQIAGKIEASTVEELLSEMNLPEGMREKAAEKIGGASQSTAVLCEKTGESLGKFSVNCISFLSGFLICALVSLMIIIISKAVFKNNALGGIDRLLGGILGGVIAWSVIYIFTVAVYALAGCGKATELAAMLEKSKVINFIYENNLITLLLWK